MEDKTSLIVHVFHQHHELLKDYCWTVPVSHILENEMLRSDNIERKCC